MDLEKILPANGPSINEVKKYIEKYSKDIILIKLGGSCLDIDELLNQLINDLSIIAKLSLNIVVVPLAIVAAIKYTAGNNPYGYAGLGDISVFVFFGLVGVEGSSNAI